LRPAEIVNIKLRLPEAREHTLTIMNSWEKLSSDLLSWYWWLSVVGFGIAINLLSSYLKPTIDKWYGTVSASRQAKLEQSDREFRAEVAAATADDAFFNAKGFEEVRWRHYQMFSFISAAFLAVAGLYIRTRSGNPALSFWASQALLLFAVIAIALSMSFGNRASRTAQVIFAAVALRITGSGSK
jgi:hypothetical protein